MLSSFTPTSLLKTILLRNEHIKIYFFKKKNIVLKNDVAVKLKKKVQWRPRFFSKLKTDTKGMPLNMPFCSILLCSNITGGYLGLDRATRSIGLGQVGLP